MSNKVNVIVQFDESSQRTSLQSMASAKSAKATSTAGEKFSSYLTMDTSFGVCTIPPVKPDEDDETKDAGVAGNQKKASRFEAFEADEESQKQTYIVRGEVEEKNLEVFKKEMAKKKNVTGVFADVAIAPTLVCPGAGPVGTHLDVERLLCVPKMKSKGMTGTGVTVAIVDTGVNMAHLNAQGKTPNFDAAWSWKPASSTITLGSAPVGHGTMCAFDVCIAAPKCTLLDIALLTSTAAGPTVMSGFLSDAILAYSHLINYVNRPKRPGENASLVVNNSWGMFHPSWDFPVGDAGNFSHNPNHPFNLIVKRLALKGADILFAAGNCGPECPDGRCQGVTNAGIYGANSSRYVTCVVGVATNLDRVGYSNAGPGNLQKKKPDITAYTHFNGSGVYSADGGTSAACPVAAGVVAAIRTKRPYIPGSSITTPASIRNMLRSTANDLGSSGYDYLYGYGVLNGCAIVRKMYPRDVFNICDRYPHICDLIRRDTIRFDNFCRQYPHLCRRIDPDRFRLPETSEVIAKQAEDNDQVLLEALNAFLGGEKTTDVIIVENIEQGCNCKDH